MIFNSMRWRLQLWHGLILIGVLLAFALTAYHVARDNQLRRIDLELDRRLMTLARPPTGQPPDRPPDFPPGESGGDRRPNQSEMLHHIRDAVKQGIGLDPLETNSVYVVLWNKDGSVLAHSPAAPINVPRPEGSPPPDSPPPQPQLPAPDNSASPRPVRPRPPPFLPGRTRGGHRELYRYLPTGECILVGRSLALEMAAMRRLAYWLTAAGAGVLALGLAGGFWLASRAIHPIEDISATALKISAGVLSQRINVADTENELGHLAAVLNSTFARLEAAFAQQARFTADASHELRTPVSVILTQTQSALSRSRNEAEYREALEACQRSAQRMRKLTSALLELARLDAGQETVKHEPFDLAKVARDSVELIRPLAAERGIEVLCDFHAAESRGDAQRIGQVATNLLTNAIHFNRDRGQVRVSTRAENGSAIFTVSDTGPGIPTEDVPHIFERFYRADKSRSGAQGGTGLGLAICKAIVNSHAGNIEVKSNPETGSVFRVELPQASELIDRSSKR